MERPIYILHLEDNQYDAQLVQSKLKYEKINYEYFLTDCEEEFISFLREKKIDIILSDYHLPDYSGAEALRYAREAYSHIPFVFVSGTMGEDAAIESLLNGATDYVLKNKLERLIPAITRALREAKLNEILRQKDEQYRILVEGMNEGLYMVDNEDNIQFVNQQFCILTGYSPEDLLEKNRLEILITPENKEFMKEKLRNRINNIKEIYEIELRKKDKSDLLVNISESAICSKEGVVIGYVGVVQDISERKLAEQTILLQGAALNAAANAIMICNYDGSIVWVNQAFTSLTGYCDDEVLGKNPKMILNSGNQTSEFYLDLWNTIRLGNTWKGELINKKKDNSQYIEEQIITPIRNSKGTITHFVAIKIDITERKQIEQNLIHAKEKAEESDKLKTAFLQNISHEIRTPMNAITGFSQLLSRPNITDEKRNEFTSIICQGSNQLLSIITDIVNIATIEAGQETNNVTSFDLNELLLSLFKQFEDKLKKENVDFKYQLLPVSHPYIIETDETKLTQILTNLINNAYKFTSKGFIEVGVIEHKNELEFYVSDSGIGIPENIQAKIFERFQQADGSTSKLYGGMGLGLSISKAYVELLGGKIGLTSTEGKGSRFYFTIPNASATNQSVTDEDSESMFAIPAGKTILVAEDEDYNFYLVEEILSLYHCNVIRAFNGIEAVEQCKTNSEIELVIMDIKMPFLDGYEATKRIKEFRPDLPIIAQTAYAFESDRQQALEVGCSDYISKPIQCDMLLSMIQRLMQ